MAFPNRYHEHDFYNFSDETDIRCNVCNMLHDISMRQCPFCGQVTHTKYITPSSYWEQWKYLRETYPDETNPVVKTEEDIFVDMLLED